MKLMKMKIFGAVLAALCFTPFHTANAAGRPPDMNTPSAVKALFTDFDASTALPMPVAKAVTKGPGETYPGGDCVPVKNIGCYFSGAPTGKHAPLLIYYRGWLSDTNYPGGGLNGGHITGEANILRSARAALDFYGLKRLAQEKGLVVLVTGSSDIVFTRQDVASLQRELDYVFPEVHVAAHSGGYVGLSASIGSLDRVDGIILLDPFYSDFSARLRPWIKGGAACGGFYTPHNEKRYNEYFSSLGCAVESRSSASDHERYVPTSLNKNLP